jgi:signal transduction histidine kinase
MTAKLLEYVEEFRDRWGFSIAFSVTGEEIPLTASQQIAVFRVVQEGLTNARKYSRASCIGVDIVYDRDEVTVRIDDDGVGLDATAGESHAGGGHRGIPGMRERLELVGGSFEIASGPHAGTHITVTLPAGRQ